MLVGEVVAEDVAVVVVVNVVVAVVDAVVVVSDVVIVEVSDEVKVVDGVLVAVEVAVVVGDVVGVESAQALNVPSANEPTAWFNTETTSSQFLSSRTKPLAVHLISDSTPSAYPSTTAFTGVDALQLPDKSLTNVLPLADAHPRVMSSPVQSATASFSFVICTSHLSEATLK